MEVEKNTSKKFCEELLLTKKIMKEHKLKIEAKEERLKTNR